ncbi:Fructose-1,6-bisphosphatase class 1 [Gracilariopsis chorda]|uniref:Fructose-1,6-bisphosphatase class 1 n=1 Tax=Gracilariopsis chorda TaxID=448386 RepID=A0A2V3IGV3_9FLOR|nr:Fructose-1,6-bisphosphatase class 1 [Gracilariopsis chorda]|eukprot:PXF41253.1 Fructose-1,6-bisphosphatase class 1 [Gracilariopsis chorda]
MPATPTPPFGRLPPSAHSQPPAKRLKPSHMATAAPPIMEIVSPASPMGLRLSSDVNKAATVFLSHVRRTFARFPVDYTGELVRLLDDIATFTCSLASSVAYDPADSNSDTAIITQLYRLLAADGYCCIVLAKGMDQPLTFDDSVLHGNYVVCVSPLDKDTIGSDERDIAGMTFSVYKRKSSASLPGRGKDLQQKLLHQVAAGYAAFSSATTLYYTMGHGVYSFVLHPVALQYFLQPAMKLVLPENPTVVYSDRAMLKTIQPISNSLSKLVHKMCCSMFTTGCLVGDVHQLLQTGGLLVAADVHLMCEAAPLPSSSSNAVLWLPMNSELEF